MEYGVLTQVDNFMYLAPEKISIDSTGVKEIIIKISDAIAWLEKNTNRKLIITMPLDPSGRSFIEANLRKYDDRCIVLEPAVLLHDSRSVFSNTQDLAIGILGQIRKIITDESISA